MPEQVTESTLVGDILHQWSMKEYEEHPRTKRWFVVMGILGTVLVVYGLLSGNFLFSLIILLAAIILYLQSVQAPKDVLFSITDLGIIIGSRFYSYKEIRNFYIIYQPPEVKSLYFDFQSVYRPSVQIPIDTMNPLLVRSTLSIYLTEDLEKEKEPLSEQFARNWQIH
ncbi:MAG: hypothetical protein KBD15_03820 [Candidatus Magasanikbacteria bacterium]|jgi:hypothetical protein|nr:hypothetical protein [Candidatus Magasanikbacteria bacterium]